MKRNLSFFDNLLNEFGNALGTLTSDARPISRTSPSADSAEQQLTDKEKTHAAGLMRVNHSGEICAQALYKGQALTARLPKVRAEMEKAAQEEQDHLAWCEERINELGSHTSMLNPLWYGLSFGIGAATGLVSDKLSLGFVAATEDQVCEHLESHLEKLPPTDQRSRAIIQQMRKDEEKHSHAAIKAGGASFPKPVKAAMTLVSRAMTTTSYKI